MDEIEEIDKIRSLVGEITKEQIKHVDCFVGQTMGVFMPLTGQCYYAATSFHTHPTYMFLIPFDDQTTLVMEHRAIDLKPWRLYDLGPNIKHHEEVSGEIPRYMAVFIKKPLVEDCLVNYEINKDNLFTGQEVKVQVNLVKRIKYFMLECENNLSGTKEVIGALELDICHQLIRNLLNVSYKNEQVTDRLEVNQALNFLQAHYFEQLTVKRIAQEVNMSASHFSRVFKQEMGTTITEYLKQIRIKAVKKLLVKDELTLTEIAHQSGFNSLSYMSTCFSNYNQMSPSEYRDMLKK